MGDIQCIIHTTQISDQKMNLLLLGLTAQLHEVSNLCIALCCCRNLCVIRNDLGQIHGICRTVNDMCTVVSKSSTGLVCHGMYNTQQCVGECHTSQALCIVHAVPLCHISIVGFYQIMLDHLNGM